MGTARTWCTLCTVRETCTATPSPVPVAAASAGVTVSTVDELDELEEVPEDELEPEPDEPDAGANPIAVTRPGVDAPEGRLIETGCPRATLGSLVVSGTATARAVVVTW